MFDFGIRIRFYNMLRLRLPSLVWSIGYVQDDPMAVDVLFEFGSCNRLLTRTRPIFNVMRMKPNIIINIHQF